ncbi:Alpha/Beta hydrolase protein [Mycena latifolia]|nr:Alpha/Beta hydrolase protein [Mycena latifolia]
MPRSVKTQYAQLDWMDYLTILAVVLPLPAVLLWSALTTAYASHNSERSLRRILGDTAIRHCVTYLSTSQIQSVTGTTLSTYMQWTKQTAHPSIVDDLGGGARLLWIGPKHLDRVILVVHGGAFMLPIPYFALTFWKYVQTELTKQDIRVGVAVLNYSLTPPAKFPTPLNQTRLALEFLLAAGVQPRNLQLVGDSAGGNLILQLLSQLLHPCAAVPEIRLPAPLRGVCLVSPWVALIPGGRSTVENAGKDYISAEGTALYGAQILTQFPEADRAFANPSTALPAWFAGVEGQVERVLVTVGEAECLRDDIVGFAEGLKGCHRDVKLVVQKGGLHVDMYLDFLVGEKKLGRLTGLLVEWLAAGFART